MMMKNLTFIKNIFSDFYAKNDLTQASIELLNKKINRFKNNFNPDIEDFKFTLDFELKQPHKELIEKLQSEGKHHIITNNPCDAKTQETMKNEYSLKLRIYVSALVYAPTLEVDDDDNEIFEERICHIGAAKYDFEENKIVMAASPAAFKKHLKSAIVDLNKWFDAEFGKCNDY